MTLPPPPTLYPLGEGELPPGVGPKAANLHLAKRQGLPVPKAYLLAHQAFALAQENDLAKRKQDLAAWLDLPATLGDGKWAVRSAFSAEDDALAAAAGRYTSVLDVDGTNAQALAEAVQAVWASADDSPNVERRDVLLMRMVPALAAGVAFTEAEYLDDRVNHVDGTAQALLAGETAGQALDLPQLLPNEAPPKRPPAHWPAWAPRLQRLLRVVREDFGPDQDVEWADDGMAVWLLQVRAITRPTRRNEAFTAANHKEILPPLPSRFMSSLIGASARRLFSYYRQFDPQLPRQRPFLEVFLGRPYINLSLLTEMMRRWGLPTSLVTKSIGGTDDTPTPLNPRRVLRHARPLMRQAKAQRQAVPHARQTIAELERLSQDLPETWSGLIDRAQTVYVTLVTEMMNLTAAMSGPMALLRKTGSLARYSARHQAATKALYDDLRPLAQRVAQHPDWHQAIRDGYLPEAPLFREAWAAYLERHGHRGVYESDLAQPRLADNPWPTLKSLLHTRPTPAKPPRMRLIDHLMWPMWRLAKGPLAARETLRDRAMRAFAAIREGLLIREADARAKLLLPPHEPGCVWDLPIHRLRELDASRPVSDRELAQYREALAEWAQYELPDVFRRFDNLEAYRTPADGTPAANAPSRHTGWALTQGTVRGKAWVLGTPSVDLPAGFSPQNTVLVARAVDAGWAPTFGLVAGVAVETGGDLSHGSILLRELGLPAVTNLSGVFRHLQTGDTVELDAQRGVLTRLEAPEQPADAANQGAPPAQAAPAA